MLENLRAKVAQMINPYSFSGVTLLNESDNIFDVENLSDYAHSLYLHQGASMIAQSVSTLDYRLDKVLNLDGELQQVHTHPLFDVLAKPNENHTYREQTMLSILYYLLSGEIWWYSPDFGKTKRLDSIYVLRPDVIQIARNEQDEKIYKYPINGKEFILNTDDVLFVKNPDPVSPTRGIGAVRVARQRVQSEKEGHNYLNAYFKKRGVPTVAVMTDFEQVSPSQDTEARKTWERNYANSNSSFFSNKVKEIKILDTSPRDAGVRENLNGIRDDIMGLLHIPQSMYMSNDINAANAETGQRQYYAEAIMPIANVLEDLINNKILDVTSKQLMFSFVNRFAEDRKALIDEAKALVGSVITQNEARQILGYDEIEGADVLREVNSINNNQIAELQSKAKRLLKSRPLLVKTLTIESMVQNAVDKIGELERGLNPVFHTKELQEMYIKAYEDNREDQVSKLDTHTKDFINGQAQRVVSKIKQGKSLSEVFSLTEEVNMAQSHFEKFILKMYETELKAVANAILDERKKDGSNYIDPQWILEIQNRIRFFTRSINENLYVDIERLMYEGLEAGLSPIEIAKNIEEHYQTITPARAERIARTEASYIVSKATNDAYMQSPIITGKVWLTTGDGNVRPYRGGKVNPSQAGTKDDHVQNNRVVVPKDARFPNGEMFPGELCINCRCVIAPAI